MCDSALSCSLQVLGIIAIAIGAWAIASGNTFGFVTGSQLIGGSALLIIIGSVIVIIAAVGVFGAIFKLRPILLIVSGLTSEVTEKSAQLSIWSH